MRIVIGGSPRAGKTTLSAILGITPVWRTDDLIALGWSEASESAALWLDTPDSWVVEGTAAVRALRKWMAAHPGKPCDRLIWLDTPHEPLSPGQESMRKGCNTVLAGIRAELVARGVEIVTTGP